MYSKLLARIPMEPWAIQESALIGLFNRLSAVDASVKVPQVTSRVDIVGPVDWNLQPMIPQLEEINGVGVIRVNGALAGDVGWIDALYGAYDYEWLCCFLDQALENTRIKQILIVYNTLGGSVVGGAETADCIAEARAQKPVVSYCENWCTSMGVYLAVQSTACYARPTAMYGSIGTKLAFIDCSKNWEQNGLKLEIFTSNGLGEASPLKGIFTPGKPVTDPERQFLKDQTHFFGAQFRQAVLQNRPQAKGVSFDGGYVSGTQAVADGLLDGTVNCLEELIAALSISRGTRPT